MPVLVMLSAALFGVASLASAEEPPSPTETVVKLTVHPMAAPLPCLKYQLVPELYEMNPGNPIQAYMKCFAEQYMFFHNKESINQRETWLTAPLHELPLAQMENYGGSALRQADYAARLETPDWQLLLQLRAQGYRLLLPDIQQLRELASALKVRLRSEIAAHRYPDAIRTLKTLIALARHLGDHPTSIGNLVGIAIAFLSISPIDEMIQEPGCPNLYWALTVLPSPLVSTRTGMQGDRTLQALDFVGLDENAPMTTEQLKRVTDHFSSMIKEFNLNGPKPIETFEKWLLARVGDESRIQAARKKLVASGMEPNMLARFPSLQILLLGEKLAFETRRDDEMRAAMLPHWQAESILQRNQEPTSQEANLFDWMLMQRQKVRLAQIRLEQRIALLRCVEAIRLHAAAHQGALPRQLEDAGVPIPVDPITGKPFPYEVMGRTAIVRGTPPTGREREAAFNVRYEVTIASAP